MNEKEQIKKADRHQDKMHKYHVEAREVQDAARNAPYKKKIAKKMPKKVKTYMGRPIEELKKEAGIGKYKDRYQ